MSGEYPEVFLNPPLIDATVVIPTVNDSAMTFRAIEACRANSQGHKVEYVVVDDGSWDAGAAEELAAQQGRLDYRLRRAHQNAGFASAANLGMHAALGRILLLLNNDVEITSPWVGRVLELFDADARLGVVGAHLMRGDGTTQHAGCYKVPGRLEYPHSLVPGETGYCWRVTGAFFALRREVLLSLGGLSIAYGIAYDDVDYCLRCWEQDWRVAYCADLTAVHAEGATRGRTPEQKRERFAVWSFREEAAQRWFYRRWRHVAHVENFLELHHARDP